MPYALCASCVTKGIIKVSVVPEARGRHRKGLIFFHRGQEDERFEDRTTTLCVARELGYASYQLRSVFLLTSRVF